MYIFYLYFQAEKKGATATEYGLVFGVFELVVFIISPIYGQFLNRIGAKLVFNSGILTSGVTAILFGLLDRVPVSNQFWSMCIKYYGLLIKKKIFIFIKGSHSIHFTGVFNSYN